MKARTILSGFAEKLDAELLKEDEAILLSGGFAPTGDGTQANDGCNNGCNDGCNKGCTNANCTCPITDRCDNACYGA